MTFVDISLSCRWDATTINLAVSKHCALKLSTQRTRAYMTVHKRTCQTCISSNISLYMI